MKMKAVAKKNIKILLIVVLMISSLTAYVIAQELENPLGNGGENISIFAAKITQFVLTYIASPLVVAAVIYSGFLFMVSGGKPEELKKARQALIYAIAGTILIAIAFGVGETVKTFYKSG